MNDNNDLSKLDYPGELTLEALAILDKYISSCCNKSETARRLNKKYIQVRKYLKQPYVREIFQLALMRKGVNFDSLSQAVADGMKATSGVYFMGKKVADEINWLAREKYAHLGFEVFEVLKYNIKEAHITANTNFLIQFSPEEKNEYEKLRSGITVSLVK